MDRRPRDRSARGDASVTSIRETSRRLAIAFSLANLCWLRIWAELFTIGTRDAYYQKIAGVDFAAAASGVLLLGALFFAFDDLLRRAVPALHQRVVRGGFVVIALWQASFIGHRDHPGLLSVLDWWRTGQALAIGGTLLGFLAVSAAAWRWRERVATVVASGLLALSPFMLLTFGRAAWTVLSLDPTTTLASRAPAIGTPQPSAPGPRLVVLLFDELDRRVAFDERPPGLTLPAFDAFRAEAIDATSVREATPKTRMSIPTLLTGLPVADATPIAASELLLTVADTEPARSVRWSEQESLLSTAHAGGGVAIIAGWYHPYCRVLTALSACSWYPSGTRASHGQDDGILHALRDQSEALIPYVAPKLRHAEIEERIAADGKWAVTAGGAGFVLVHVPVPHKPWIGMSFPTAEDGYRTNLALADARLAGLRAEMEEAGNWDSTSVLVTSDHGWREGARKTGEKHPRIPWLLKIAGSREPRTVTRDLQMLTLVPILDGVLRGEIATADDIVTRLEAPGPN